MNWKIGNYVLILSTLTIAKIISVRKTGSIETLWVKNKSGEFPMSALKGSKAFNIKYGPGNSQESIAVPLESVLTLLGLVIGFGIILYFC